MVLPFYHSGMGEVLPMGAVVFRAGKTITVNIGEWLWLAWLQGVKSGLDERCRVGFEIAEK